MISVTRGFRARLLSGQTLERHLDQVMGALVEAERGNRALLDAAIAADLGRNAVEITLTIAVDDIDEAERLATACIVAAVTAAGGEFRLTATERTAAELLD